MSDAEAASFESGEMCIVEPDAVGDTQISIENTLVVKILDLVPPSFELPDGSRLFALLQGVGMHRPVAGE